jgi:type IV pilus assembly protein PilV
MLSKRVQTDRGFTLLEVLVALIILAIGLLAVASMQTSALSSNSFAQRVTVVTALAQGALEDLMARPGTDAIFQTDAANVNYDLDPQVAATTRTIQGVTYSATYTIDANNPVTGVARVEMTVTGGGRTLTLTSYKRSVS